MATSSFDFWMKCLVHVASKISWAAALVGIAYTSVVVTGEVGFAVGMTLLHMFLGAIAALAFMVFVDEQSLETVTKRLVAWRCCKVVTIWCALGYSMLTTVSVAYEVIFLLFVLLAVAELLICGCVCLLFRKKIGTQLEVPKAVKFEVKTWSVEDGSAYGQETCMICLDTFQKEELVGRLPCNHVFHDHCFKAWEQHANHNQSICPLRCEQADDQVAAGVFGHQRT
eukprot:TRINITY_DN47664_c0_g1_i1.p1 TRINITY_DN47664_c0_g1~~TRINITY_DN47664_c0_g1_i1.p1  ORF type:complete len:226 (-),score=35.33 TRINITY_DN47664_c0_g1_i1:62-739(-)